MALQGYRPHLVIMDEIVAFASRRKTKGDPVVLADDFRGMDGEDQLVEINSQYGYAWGGTGLLQVGDIVVLPGANGRTWWVGRVSDMGSRWPGQHKRILRRATLRDVEEYRRRIETKEL